MESKKLKTYQNRLFVAELINDVLLSKKTVLEAINLFPRDIEDINLKCAFDALIHREADEDIRLKDKEYAVVQDDFLQELAEILKTNERLPKNIISGYFEYHKDKLISYDNNKINNFIKNLKRMINF